MIKILDVKMSKNPVQTGETFLISVTVFAYEPEEPKKRLPFRLGRRTRWH